MDPRTALFLADLILVVHWGFVCFITMGLGAIWLGALAGLGFARSRLFRSIHLGAMALVLAESLLGLFCPLTQWEFELRSLAGQPGAPSTTFLDHWAQRLFYWDLSEGTFLLLYAAFFLLVLLTWKLVPVRPRRSADIGKSRCQTRDKQDISSH